MAHMFCFGFKKAFFIGIGQFGPWKTLLKWASYFQLKSIQKNVASTLPKFSHKAKTAEDLGVLPSSKEVHLESPKQSLRNGETENVCFHLTNEDGAILSLEIWRNSENAAQMQLIWRENVSIKFRYETINLYIITQ